ncbi:hypothetical protein QO001_004220 [Methylobacterium brachiatum]|uniref:Uncharacterized protein n=1 Tax=Methylobacterium brachiatum TaxID=269660 RepID=A0AAJ1WXC7_9HYPH|nr:hypothetical protein [Methylobacterium brachiatum]MCB4804264.1 hypothetical protein [Methylobacterium brachiatum]MDQ0545277.1 hypothetical protein [Methylobacterium brachiatum]
MAWNPNVPDLFKSKDAIDEEVNAAVDAVLANVSHAPRALADGCVHDLKAAIQASTFATLILADVHATRRQKQHAARTAILLAHPVMV